MGFPSVCYAFILPLPVAIVLFLLERLKLAVLRALLLGLASSPPSSSVADNLYPFAYSVHLRESLISPAVVKSRLLCAVCLSALEPCHEVRHLGNCAHLFHKTCIDKWVDVGQHTCPLCRTFLPCLPEATNINWRRC